MSDPYQGMRWMKCDLQVQTPEDSRHWLDDDLRLSNPRRPRQDGQADEGDIQDKARRFLARCHELELDVIGVTDHNFSGAAEPRDWFALHLVEQNRAVARDFNRNPLAIFPGFEVDIGYHVLCLFKPAKKHRDFERCSRILTKLGLPPDARFDSAGPRQLRYNSQRVSLKRLLEIVQNEHDGIVIAAHADQERGILNDTANRDDYAIQDLCCVELTQNPPTAKFQEILSGGNNAWSRRYSHPAVVMSSDAKSLKTKDGAPIANSLGYRHTWIKMSQPSIESLRQAFLDQESRIRLPVNILTDTNPGLRHRQAKIGSISISGALFLDDQTVEFSRNLNCIIGGRGSGKSSLLEYLRIACGHDDDSAMDSASKQRVDRVRKTLQEGGARIEVVWESSEGVKDTFTWERGTLQAEGRELEDPSAFFHDLPIRFFSQQQLNNLTAAEYDGAQHRQAQRLLELIDGFAQSELDALEEREDRVIIRIQAAFANLRKAAGIEAELRKKRQEFQEIDRQWQARSEIQEEVRRYQQLKSESRYLETLHGHAGEKFSDVVELARKVADAHVTFPDAETPHAAWFKEYDQKVKAAKDALACTIRDAVEEYEARIQALRIEDPVWREIEQELDAAEARFREACEEKGLSPDDVGRLQEIGAARSQKNAEIENTQAELQRVREEAGDPERLMGELAQIWREQFARRNEAAERANTAATLRRDRQRFIEVSAIFQQDRSSFRKHWQEFSPGDGRTRLGRYWGELGEALLSRWSQKDGGASPWQLLHDFVKSNGPATISDRVDEFYDELRAHIESNPQKWEALRCSRVRDSVDLQLFRPDGSVAGSIAEDSLSDGQRNTAALALLLAQEGGPLVIDQPEDELDSNFVFRELIPMLREVKPRRQLILATHNANLPVNGDAELVYALEAKEGRGVPLAQGGLDRSSVTTAVLDIMEGSEEAFRRRRAMYHF